MKFNIRGRVRTITTFRDHVDVKLDDLDCGGICVMSFIPGVIEKMNAGDHVEFSGEMSPPEKMNVENNQIMKEYVV